MYLTCDSSNPRSIGCPYAPTSTPFTEEGIATYAETKEQARESFRTSSTPLQQEGSQQLQLHLHQLQRQRRQ